ncbi:MAG: hypothetical protein M1822_008971 [Bathelium mastoideum]|nr:MAG: hypothetical protein M1822_008971 [Bathelium mastoideum]
MNGQPARASSESDDTMADLSNDLGLVKFGTHQSAAVEFSFGGRDRASPTSRLPFPFKVRKQIYELLLLSKNVIDDPDDGSPHSYQFYPAILSTSRTTSKESRQILYKANVFVLVRHFDNCFERNTMGSGVPFVSTKNLDHFREHRLAANFTSSKPHKHTASEGVCEECMRDPELKTCLLLAQDLYFLCRMFKALSFSRCGKYTFIKSARDQRLTFATVLPNCSEYLIDLEVRASSFGPPSLEEQKAVLEPFRAIHGSTYKVSIQGNVDAGLADGIKKEMAQSVLWVYAMGWDFVEMARQLKCEANRAITAGNLKHAASRYRAIFDIWGHRILPCEENGTYKRGECCDWKQSLTTISFDAKYMLGLLALRQDDLDEAELFLGDMMVNVLRSCHGSNVMMCHALHFSAILESEKGDFPMAYKVMDGVVKRLPSITNMQADMSILEAFCSCLCPSWFSTIRAPTSTTYIQELKPLIFASNEHTLQRSSTSGLGRLAGYGAQA